MKQKAKSAVAVAAACLLAVSLTGCGGTNSTKQEEPQNETTQQEQSAPAPEPEPEDTLESHVSITDVSLSEIKVYSTSVDSYDPERGYVIQATVTNDNDESCDITPYFAVDITGDDDYGAEQTQRVIISGSEIFTPYGPEPAMQSMQPVGLAPHETKDVRYYVYLDGAGPILASPLSNDKEDTSEDYGIGPLDSIPLGGDEDGKYYSHEITSLANVEVVSFSVAESSMTYIPADEWGKGVILNEEYDDGSSWGGYPTYESIITGSIANPTQDRWLSATAQFDVALSGQTLNSAGLRGTYATLDHVDRGASAELTENSIVTTQNDYDVTLTPALLAYEPDLG